MKRLLLVLLLLSQSVQADNITQIHNPPPPIDLEIVNRMWTYIQKQTQAPDTVPAPYITLDWEVPIIGRMGTQFPNSDFPDLKLQISVAPRTVDMWEREMVLYGIGHEMVHYAFILKENEWNASKKQFVVKRLHHCDPEFKAITKGIADLLWDVWHSSTLRAKMYDEIVKSCANFPHQ